MNNIFEKKGVMIIVEPDIFSSFLKKMISICMLKSQFFLTFPVEVNHTVQGIAHILAFL